MAANPIQTIMPITSALAGPPGASGNVVGRLPTTGIAWAPGKPRGGFQQPCPPPDNNSLQIAGMPPGGKSSALEEVDREMRHNREPSLGFTNRAEGSKIELSSLAKFSAILVKGVGGNPQPVGLDNTQQIGSHQASLTYR